MVLFQSSHAALVGLMLLASVSPSFPWKTLPELAGDIDAVQGVLCGDHQVELAIVQNANTQEGWVLGVSEAHDALLVLHYPTRLAKSAPDYYARVALAPGDPRIPVPTFHPYPGQTEPCDLLYPPGKPA